MLRRIRNNQRGSAIALFALGLTVLAGLAGLVVDAGYLYVQQARLQNGVDAACLAGAAYLPNTAAADDAAITYAKENKLLPEKLESEFGGNNLIRLKYTEVFDTFFFRLLGVDKATIRVAAAAILPVGVTGPSILALQRNANNPTLIINGSGLYVDGSIHSNSLLRMNGWATVTGDATSSGSPLSLGNNVNVQGNKADGADFIDAPDYSAQIDALPTQSYGTSQRFNGNNTTIDGTISVNGNVDINGNNISGNGSILATGDIHNNGNAITQTGDGQMFIYTSDGNIHINGNNITIDATLFAPHGDIVINGNNITITGRVIGNTVTINGSGIRVNGESGSGAGQTASPRLVE
jgi:hypothetical protein